MADKDQTLIESLASIPVTYDKSVGSPIYDTLATAAEQFAKIDANIDAVRQKLSIDKLTGDELAQRIKERTGIERKAATHSRGSVTVTGTGTIFTGDLFETAGSTQFQAIETKAITDNGTVNVKAVVAGHDGDVPANTITLFPVTLAGFTAVNNPQPTIDGFNAESDEDLLQRYYERVRTPATSGNKAHYKNWAKEVPGVGDARIISLWKGDNTVKVIIIDSEKRPASETIVAAVQNHIDPGSTGKGEGAAPMGAFTTVVSAAAVAINVSVTVSISAGYTIQQVMDNITVRLTEHLQEIAFVESIVSYAKVGATILDSEGVTDYTDLLVNNATVNVPIKYEEVAVVGAVVVNG
ncbi:baseplate J/gp47 family protein [Brevibacillus sp. DP1.3A]|uniref:baseplate J/gp47 family protein n=1 Tax=Brevibacillus sp. DP1.3A TaxID=2738867 RepID=UPI00156AB578|nr:baseplate J/gp47 family protein [Brevibacillus sp. DP1.3A]UED78057.1 baseplate J/gp47 family protein [Brevibacillus sp. DP1.3A]